MMPVHTKDQVPGKIIVAERRRRQVIKQYNIGSATNVQFSDTREIGTEWAEDSPQDMCVMCESQVEYQVSRHGSGVYQGQFVQEIRRFHLLHHIHAETIVAKTNVQPGSQHFFDGCPSDGIVHIRTWIMYTIGTCSGQPANFTTSHTHTMRSDTTRSQNAGLLQAINDAHVIARSAIKLVGNIFDNMDMETYP